jgi:hypothetical protein
MSSWLWTGVRTWRVPHIPPPRSEHRNTLQHDGQMYQLVYRTYDAPQLPLWTSPHTLPPCIHRDWQRYLECVCDVVQDSKASSTWCIHPYAPWISSDQASWLSEDEASAMESRFGPTKNPGDVVMAYLKAPPPSNESEAWWIVSWLQTYVYAIQHIPRKQIRRESSSGRSRDRSRARSRGRSRGRSRSRDVEEPTDEEEESARRYDDRRRRVKHTYIPNFYYQESSRHANYDVLKIFEYPDRDPTLVYYRIHGAHREVYLSIRKPPYVQAAGWVDYVKSMGEDETFMEEYARMLLVAALHTMADVWPEVTGYEIVLRAGVPAGISDKPMTTKVEQMYSKVVKWNQSLADNGLEENRHLHIARDEPTRRYADGLDCVFQDQTLTVSNLHGEPLCRMSYRKNQVTMCVMANLTNRRRIVNTLANAWLEAHRHVIDHMVRTAQAVFPSSCHEAYMEWDCDDIHGATHKSFFLGVKTTIQSYLRAKVPHWEQMPLIRGVTPMKPVTRADTNVSPKKQANDPIQRVVNAVDHTTRAVATVFDDIPTMLKSPSVPLVTTTVEKRLPDVTQVASQQSADRTRSVSTKSSTTVKKRSPSATTRTDRAPSSVTVNKTPSHAFSSEEWQTLSQYAGPVWDANKTYIPNFYIEKQVKDDRIEFHVLRREEEEKSTQILSYTRLSSDKRVLQVHMWTEDVYEPKEILLDREQAIQHVNEAAWLTLMEMQGSQKPDTIRVETMVQDNPWDLRDTVAETQQHYPQNSPFRMSTRAPTERYAMDLQYRTQGENHMTVETLDGTHLIHLYATPGKKDRNALKVCIVHALGDGYRNKIYGMNGSVATHIIQQALHAAHLHFRISTNAVPTWQCQEDIKKPVGNYKKYIQQELSTHLMSNTRIPLIQCADPIKTDTVTNAEEKHQSRVAEEERTSRGRSASAKKAAAEEEERRNRVVVEEEEERHRRAAEEEQTRRATSEEAKATAEEEEENRRVEDRTRRGRSASAKKAAATIPAEEEATAAKTRSTEESEVAADITPTAQATSTKTTRIDNPIYKLHQTSGVPENSRSLMGTNGAPLYRVLPSSDNKAWVIHCVGKPPALTVSQMLALFHPMKLDERVVVWNSNCDKAIQTHLPEIMVKPPRKKGWFVSVPQSWQTLSSLYDWYYCTIHETRPSPHRHVVTIKDHEQNTLMDFHLVHDSTYLFTPASTPVWNSFRSRSLLKAIGQHFVNHPVFDSMSNVTFAESCTRAHMNTWHIMCQVDGNLQLMFKEWTRLLNDKYE